VSDDGSCDKTVEIVKRYARKNSLVKLVHSTAQGVNENFTSALAACSGEYIALSDQDDIWHQEKLAQLATACDGKTLLAYGKSELIDENNQPLNTTAEAHLGIDHFRQGSHPFYFIFSNCVSGHSMMVAKQLLECALPFPASCIYDHWIALVASVKSEIVFAPEAVTYHRIHALNTINNIEKNRAAKKTALKRPKFVRFNAQRQAILLRIEKGLEEGNGLSNEERLYLIRLKNRVTKLEKSILDFPLLIMLFQSRAQLFHGDLLRECRNRALGGRYFKLLDFLSNR
jgi:glycosyltransferase involved in cell wall biosynthesis